MIEPGVYPLTIYEGVALDETIVWKADGELVDNTNWSALLQVRDRSDAEDVLLALSSDEGTILLGGENAEIRLLVGTDVTGAITFRHGVYDLKMFPPDPTDSPERLLEGPVRFSPGVTR